ncbi:hypothetical protein [Kitasatospora sp. NPDC005856]|uniref:hypothetical protein n=1 Tax=Kitasatospora sp. NPDC005856 TaxID=3154566 RepID=UPI00340A0D0F
MTAHRRRPALAVAVLAALALFTTACSGSDGGSAAGGSAASGAGQGTQADKAREFRACLRENGLQVREPAPGRKGTSFTIEEGSSDEQIGAAMAACRDKGVASGFGGELTQEQKDNALKFTACVRAKGVDLEDPKFDGTGTKALPTPPPGMDQPTFDRIFQDCMKETR